MEIIRKITERSSLSKQGSLEWLKLRECSVGGSEIGNIINDKGYKTLLKSKFGITVFKGNICTIWGNIFEHVIKNMTEHKTCNKIYELSLIPGITKDEKMIQHYSPDGISCCGEDVILYEFKCPYNRLPTKTIPIKYRHQMQLGLMTIPEVKYVLYVESVFKSCSKDDFNFARSYDTSLHCDNKVPTGDVNCIGFISIYKTSTRNMYSDMFNMFSLSDFLHRYKDISGIDMINTIIKKKYIGSVFSELSEHLNDIKARPSSNSYCFTDLLKHAYNKTEGFDLYYSNICYEYSDDWLSNEEAIYARLCSEHGWTHYTTIYWKNFGGLHIKKIERDPLFNDKALKAIHKFSEYYDIVSKSLDKERAIDELY